MTNLRKRTLRHRYLELTAEYERISGGMNCGNQLAEHINPRLREIREDIDAIVLEVKAAIEAEGAP